MGTSNPRNLTLKVQITAKPKTAVAIFPLNYAEKQITTGSILTPGAGMSLGSPAPGCGDPTTWRLLTRWRSQGRWPRATTCSGGGGTARRATRSGAPARISPLSSSQMKI